MPRGRPLKTEIREKIASILAHVGQSYGYEVYKMYQQVFGKITIRNLYYNIKKGLNLGEFIIVDVKRETGNFTWGGETQRIYYTVGPHGRTYVLTERQKEILGKMPTNEVKINWDKEVNQKIQELEKEVQTFKSKQAIFKYEEKTQFRSLIKHRTDMLKDWMRSKFDRQKAHDLHVRIDKVYAQLNI